MNPREPEPDNGGFKIFGMLLLIIGFSLTIIGGVLLGMFFMYPLGNVIPEDQYIMVYEEEFMFLATVLGFGIFFLLVGFIFETLAIIEEYNLNLQTKINIHTKKNFVRNLNIKNYIDEKEEIDVSDQELEKLLRKNILSEK